jgi:hypothetical protein
MWDGGEVKVRSRQRPRDDETDRAKQAGKKLEYYNDLQRMINDQNEQKRSTKANTIQSEREVSGNNTHRQPKRVNTDLQS